MKTWLTENFNIKYPIIQAPMFLVSNTSMLIEAIHSGIMGCVPALNYRTTEELRSALTEIKETGGSFGVNLIVNKSNVKLDEQIKICLDLEPDFIITSLGGPKLVIDKFKDKKTKIFCDVTDLKYALKVEEIGADAIIAVNSGAGGHAGPMAPSVLIPMLKKHCKLPIISAGGVGNSEGLLSVLALGAEGVSIGSPYIATKEASVSEEYKQAIVDYGANDIVLTTKISGTPCTVIKTPYVEKIGTEQNFIESFLNNNKSVKKYVKMLTYYKGMKALESAAFGATYKSVWCAGPSIEFTDKISSVREVTEKIVSGIGKSYETLGQVIKD